MQTTTATFEDGVLKPNGPLNLPEHATVRITIELLDWEAHQKDRLAFVEAFLHLAQSHSGEHLTRDQLHERR